MFITRTLKYIRHRIDLAFLRQLVPVVTQDYFKQSCKSGVQVVLRVRKMSLQDYAEIEKGFKIKILKKYNATTVLKKPWLSDVIEYPLNHKFLYNPKAKGIIIPPDRDSIRKLYETEEACALLPFPYLSIRFFHPRPEEEPPSTRDLDTMNGVDLYREIVRHTRAPTHVSKMARHFADSVLRSRPFLAVHWRYDCVDWMRDCTQKYLPKFRRHMCNDVQSFRPLDIALVINGILADDATGGDAINDVYIAYPVTKNDVIQKVIELLKEKFKRNVYTHVDVMIFLEEHYSSCSWLHPDQFDILSSVEMEICTQAKRFLRSESSSWSSVVWQRRSSNPNDPLDVGNRGIVHFVKSSMKKRRA